TDANGNYKLAFTGATRHLLARVRLPEAKGEILAFVSRGTIATPRQVDLNLGSTLVMGYIMSQYVKGDAAILEKLPPDVEAETRTKMGGALDKATVSPPATLTSTDVSKTVDALRQADATIDDQLEKVKRILLVGLSDQGAGRDALSVE